MWKKYMWFHTAKTNCNNLQADINAEQHVTDRFLGQEKSAANAVLLRKQDMRLIPICATMYLLAVRILDGHDYILVR
jgi:hypothetical protein